MAPSPGLGRCPDFVETEGVVISKPFIFIEE